MSEKLESIGKSSTGMDENVAALLSVIFAPLTSIIFFLIEKDSKFVKFHALQSGILAVALIIINFILGFIPIIGWIILLLLPIASLIVYIMMIVKAYKGEYWMLPIIGQIAMDQAQK